MSAASVEFEIRIANAKVGYANYPRPCIVEKVNRDGTAWVYFHSTKDYSEPGQSFRIRSDHPDFAATGLEDTSYTVHPAKLVPVSVLVLLRGVLKGMLAKEFEEWLG